MKKLFDIIFKRFWVNFALILGTAVLDLIGLGSKEGKGIGLGFILAFLYFAGFVVYNMTSKDGKDRDF